MARLIGYGTNESRQMHESVQSDTGLRCSRCLFPAAQDPTESREASLLRSEEEGVFTGSTVETPLWLVSTQK